VPPRTAALRKLFDFERRKRWTNSAENSTRVVVAVAAGGGGGGVLVLLVWSDKDDARIGKAFISSTFTFALALSLFFRCGLVLFLRLRLCFFFTRFESVDDAGWWAAVVVVGLGLEFLSFLTFGLDCRFFSLFG